MLAGVCACCARLEGVESKPAARTRNSAKKNSPARFIWRFNCLPLAMPRRRRKRAQRAEYDATSLAGASAPSASAVIPYEIENAHSVPKNAGRSGFYKKRAL